MILLRSHRLCVKPQETVRERMIVTKINARTEHVFDTFQQHDQAEMKRKMEVEPALLEAFIPSLLNFETLNCRNVR